MFPSELAEHAVASGTMAALVAYGAGTSVFGAQQHISDLLAANAEVLLPRGTHAAARAWFLAEALGQGMGAYRQCLALRGAPTSGDPVARVRGAAERVESLLGGSRLAVWGWDAVVLGLLVAGAGEALARGSFWEGVLVMAAGAGWGGLKVLRQWLQRALARRRRVLLAPRSGV
jgi:hypothetical protein